jgi:hypothetical protein
MVFLACGARGWTQGLPILGELSQKPCEVNSICYGLDFKCPPKAHKGLVPSSWHYWEVVATLRGGRK